VIGLRRRSSDEQGLANITLEYDAANMKITNLEAANKLFHYEYREGWSL
jgi:hypothetical protein